MGRAMKFQILLAVAGLLLPILLWPKTAMSSGKSLDVLNYASVSAYELSITVLGPRGISPRPSSVTPGLAQPQVKPAQMLLKQ